MESEQAEAVAALQPYLDLALQLGTALLIFIVGWIASKWAHAGMIRLLRARAVDLALGRFLATMVRYLVLAAAVITSLGKVGVETTSLVAMLGTVGLAIGLALQGSLAHFAAGVMILFFRPFVLEDVICAGGHTGVVKDIGLFATELCTPDNERIIIPNGSITGGPIINYTALGKRRGAVAIGVPHGSDLARVREALERAVRGAELVLQDPAPAVVFTGFGANALEFSVFGWALPENYGAMLQNVRLAVHRELAAAGIAAPQPQITVRNLS